MNFSLKHIEQNVSEDFLVSGEQLVEQNAIFDLRAVEKHLWIARVSNQFEVEVRITPSKVIDYSCECDHFRTAKMCEHLVGVLLMLRRRITDEKQPQASDTKGKIDKLTVSNILESADQEALHTFIREYASKNKNFAIALKARFASTATISDNKEKYLQLLEDVIKQGRKKDRLLSFHGERKLLKVVNELFQQAEFAFDKNHFVTVRLIAESIIEKLTPVIRKGYEPSNLSALVKDAFQLLHRLLDAPVAPALLETLWDYATREVKKITYKINEITAYFYDLLTKLAATLNRTSWLIDYFGELSLEPQYSDKNYTQLLIARITLLEQNDSLQEAQSLVKANLSNPDLLLFALKQAKRNGNTVQMKYLTDIGLSTNFPTPVYRQIADARLEIAAAEKDTDLQAELARALTLQTLNIKYFHLFKVAHSGDWTKAFDELIKEVEQLPFSIVQRDFIAKLYEAEGKYDELMNYIRQLKSLDMLEQFDQSLLRYFKSEVFDLYRTLLEDYIMHHLGRISSKRVRQKVSHLYNIGGATLAEALVDKFRTEYSDRQSLIEELSIF